MFLNNRLTLLFLDQNILDINWFLININRNYTLNALKTFLVLSIAVTLILVNFSVHAGMDWILSLICWSLFLNYLVLVNMALFGRNMFSEKLWKPEKYPLSYLPVLALLFFSLIGISSYFLMKKNEVSKVLEALLPNIMNAPEKTISVFILFLCIWPYLALLS